MKGIFVGVLAAFLGAGTALGSGGGLLENGGFEAAGPGGSVPEGWAYVGPLDQPLNPLNNPGTPGEHGSVGVRTAPSLHGGGNGVSSAQEGSRFLNGGRDSVFYQKVAEAMVPGTVYRFSVYATKAGSSNVIARLSFTNAPLTPGTFATEARLGLRTASFGEVGDQDSPPEWELREFSYTVPAGQAGMPLYANLESFYDAGTTVIGWDGACVSSYAGSAAAVLDAGGGRSTGGLAVQDGSLGGIAGISSTGMTTAKQGYVGQLYDAVGLEVSALPATVDEGGTRPMSAVVTMDDDTTAGLDAALVSWSESGAHLAGIDGGGLVSAGIVYQNEGGQNVGGTYASLSDPDGFDLTVLNVGVDDFGTYAGDGVDDDWQVGFFGVGDPEGVGSANKDGDGDTNLTEFLGGFDPTDPGDFLSFTVTGKTGSTVSFLLNKAIPGRTYRVMESGDLATPFGEVGSFSVPSEELDKVVQDSGAPGGRNYYRIEIEKP